MIDEVVAKYLELFPDERKDLELLLDQLDKKEKLDDRHNYRGHIAGSGLIFSPDLKKLVLIYHPTFEVWMQPGGHLEPDEDGPWQTGRRESIEETGAKLGRQLGPTDKRIPVLIESHRVPTKPPLNEPVHYHHGFWYAFVAESEDLDLHDDVIKEAKWAELYNITNPGILKAIGRVRELVTTID